jgi:hypothetical protein
VAAARRADGGVVLLVGGHRDEAVRHKADDVGEALGAHAHGAGLLHGVREEVSGLRDLQIRGGGAQPYAAHALDVYVGEYGQGVGLFVGQTLQPSYDVAQGGTFDDEFHGSPPSMVAG